MTYANLGGIEAVLQDVRELIEYPLTHPEIYAHLGVSPPRGVLLHGPPGCGKTLLAHAIAGELKVPFIKVRRMCTCIASCVSVSQACHAVYNHRMRPILCSAHY